MGRKSDRNASSSLRASRQLRRSLRTGSVTLARLGVEVTTGKISWCELDLTVLFRVWTLMRRILGSNADRQMAKRSSAGR